ncbi:DivIVA domain-containing protein [Mycolicibacterium grossiae]|uniref:DivIVA domain-containing protein n=1 Tax=Mycolicibacterium grossiae TaxID=1552759 RepID=UPI000BFEDBF9|nr:DivIVA domain-containing protein [Mycolicibacterium grossiae]
MRSVADGELTAEAVRAATFDKPRWGRRGYDEKAVRDFLQLAARRLEGRGHLSADDVRGMRFNKPRLGKRGLDEQQVDAMLAEIVRRIDEL